MVAEAIEDNVSAAKKRPFEFFAWENETGAAANVQLVINRFSGGTPRLKFALLENGGGVSATEYPNRRQAVTWSARRSSATTVPKMR